MPLDPPGQLLPQLEPALPDAPYPGLATRFNEFPGQQIGFLETTGALGQFTGQIETSPFWPAWFGSISIGGRGALIPYASNTLIGNITGIGTSSGYSIFLKELPGSGKYTFGDEVSGTRIFDVPYMLQNLVVQNLMGGYTGFDANGFPQIDLPDTFSNAYPFLFCIGVDAEPMPDTIRGLDLDTPSRIVHEHIKMTATYRPLDFDFSIETAGKIFTLRPVDWNYVGFSLEDVQSGEAVSSGKMTTDFSMIVPNGEFSFNRRMILPTMIPQLQIMEGKVNSKAFLGFPTGTLQLQSLSSRPTWHPNGQQMWRMTAKFLHDCHTHLANINASGSNFPPALGNTQPSRAPGFQFIRMANLSDTVGKLAGSPLLDFNGNVIYSQNQNFAGGLNIPIEDYGMTHLFVDFNILLNFL